jgi:hypothetical protein
LGLYQTVLVKVTLDITFMSVDPTFAIPQSVLLKDDVPFVLGVNLLSGHFSGDLVDKQAQGTADYLATTPEALCPVVL